MNHWLETSNKNLLPLSQSPIFSEAVKEWEWRGNMIESGGNGICQLCEHEYLNYQFEIKNSLTNQCLLVGSTCIERFSGIRVYDEEGNLLSGEARDKLLEKRIKRDEFERMQKELGTLLQKLQSLERGYNYRIISKGSYYNFRTISEESIKRTEQCVNATLQDDFKGFTPYEIIGLFWNMRQLNIPYTPDLYKLNLRDQKAKEQIQAVRDMERCLSHEQRKRYGFNQKNDAEQDFVTEEQLSQMLEET